MSPVCNCDPACVQWYCRLPRAPLQRANTLPSGASSATPPGGCIAQCPLGARCALTTARRTSTILNALQAGIVGLPNVGKVRLCCAAGLLCA